MAAALAALKLLLEVIKGIGELAKFIQEHREEQWFKDSADLFTRVKYVDTPEKKKELVRAIGYLWTRV